MTKTAYTFDEQNIKYLRELLGDQTVDEYFAFCDDPVNSTPEVKANYLIVRDCLRQMRESGENRWWTSKDPKVLGYYQLMNPILLVPFEKFNDAFNILLGRSVGSFELTNREPKLLSEAEKAFKG